MSEDENIHSKLNKDGTATLQMENPKFKSSVVEWFLSGDKYLHEDSQKNINPYMVKGALLYVFVFVLNEFIFHFTPYRGMGALRYFLGHAMLVALIAFGVILVSRRILFGKNRWRPNPAIGLPDRVQTRLDYQNVLPIYGERKWLYIRFVAYLDLQCGLIIAVVTGWTLMLTVSIPYFLLQK